MTIFFLFFSFIFFLLFFSFIFFLHFFSFLFYQCLPFHLLSSPFYFFSFNIKAIDCPNYWEVTRRNSAQLWTPRPPLGLCQTCLSTFGSLVCIYPFGVVYGKF